MASQTNGSQLVQDVQRQARRRRSARFTGRKETDKVYFRHSNYPGGVTAQSPREVRRSHPERLIEHAVKGMLPKNALGRQMIRTLKVYAGPEHPHTAQQPETLEV